MKKLVTCNNSARLDKEVIGNLGLGDDTLMEVAALRLWQELQALMLESGLASRKTDCRIVALCGSGNNAADGLVVLRHAVFAGYDQVSAVFTRDSRGITGRESDTKESGPSRDGMSTLKDNPVPSDGRTGSEGATLLPEGFSTPLPMTTGCLKAGLAGRKDQSLQALGIRRHSWKNDSDESRSVLSRADIILDCIAGTGLHGILDVDSSGAVEFITRLPSFRDGGPLIVSVDVPSGMSDETRPEACIVRASCTLAIEPLKTCLYVPAVRSFAGRIVPVSGVFPVSAPENPDAILLESSDLEGLLVPDDPGLYKSVRGRLAVFAGSEGMAGAAFLASTAALRSGAGYVALFCDPSIMPVLSMKSDEVLVRSCVNGSADFESRSWDAILAGPGWKVNPDSEALLASLLSAGIPAVLDAGAVELFASLFMKGLRGSGTIILTPHPGEFKRLMNIAGMQDLITGNDFNLNPVEGLKSLAYRLGVTIVLKGQVTWISTPSGDLRIWDGRESGLGTAGSGDVLAGLAGGLAAHRAAAGILESSAGSCESMVGALAVASSAVIAHGIAGYSLRKGYGWFVAGDLIEEAGKYLDPCYWNRTNKPGS